MVPVTNKLLIPCRVLDSHFYRLSDSVLTSPLPSLFPLCHHRTLPLRYIFSLSQSESLGSLPLPTLRLLLLLPMYTHPLPLFPPVSSPPISLQHASRPVSATHPLNDRHPTLSTSLSWVLSFLVLFSPVLLLYKSRRGLYARTDVPSVGLESTESRSKENFMRDDNSCLRALP